MFERLAMDQDAPDMAQDATTAADVGNSSEENRHILRQCLSDAATLPGIPSAALQAIRDRADSSVFNLVVVGEFKRGKSSLINALINADLLPVGVVPLTAIATILEYGDIPAMRVEFLEGSEQQVPLAALSDYVTEKGNPANARKVREVHIRWPSPWLKNGVRLIDTPGIGSVYLHNTDVTRRFLSRADAVLFMLSADQPMGQAEFDFLEEVRKHAGRTFFLLNKADLLSDEELEESSAFVSSVLEKAMGAAVPVYPVSARLALESFKTGSPEGLEKSRLPFFILALEKFLMEDKGNALVASLAKALSRLVAQVRFNTELAGSALSMPQQELRRKVEALEKKRGEVEQEKHDFSILLEADVKRLSNHEVTADVEAFKEALIHETEKKLQNHFNTVRHLPSGKLHESLQHLAVDEVRSAWDSFRRNEDEKLDAAFRALCERFSRKIDATEDELYRFSSELFSIPFESVAAESVWKAETSFNYKFWDTPASLTTLATSLLHAMPKFIGDPLILKSALDYSREIADTQAGRVRFDFSQRLDQNMRAFRSAMLERIDTTLEGIEKALEKSLKAAESPEQAEARARENADQLMRLSSLADRLQSLTGAA